MHISNRYMELADTVAAVGAAEGLGAFIKIDDRTQTSSPDYKMNAEVVALARRPEDVGDLRVRPGWHQRAEADVVDFPRRKFFQLADDAPRRRVLRQGPRDVTVLERARWSDLSKFSARCGRMRPPSRRYLQRPNSSGSGRLPRCTRISPSPSSAQYLDHARSSGVASARTRR